MSSQKSPQQINKSRQLNSCNAQNNIESSIGGSYLAKPSSITKNSSKSNSPKSINEEIQNSINSTKNQLTQVSNDNLLINNHMISNEDQNNKINCEQDANLMNQPQINQEQTNKTIDTKKEEKDSPAFRLRRRNTPRKFDSIYLSPYITTSSRKSNLYSPNNSDQLQAKVAKLKSGAANCLLDVKRNLFDSEKQINNQSTRRPHSPSRSLVEDVDLNVFAENISLETIHSQKLIEKKNNLNYLCLRIIEVLPLIDDYDESLNDIDHFNNSKKTNSNLDCSSITNCSSLTNNHTNCKQRLLKIYCQQAETKINLNIQKPVVLVYLFNEYVNFKDKLVPGKLIEIVKFEINKLPKSVNYKHNSVDVEVYPFLIKLKADREIDWVPLISIKKKYEPTSMSLLNVINTQRHQCNDNIEDQPPTKNPRIVFSSYVVKTEPNEQQQNNLLAETKSPTIKRFMKTINKTYAEETINRNLKMKIKRERS